MNRQICALARRPAINVCIIPARGGSKRIPHKNIRPFCNRPIVQYTIDAALACGCFKRVIVSTDDVNIKTVAAGAGAEVPFDRPEALADDHSTVLTSVKHAIEWLKTEGETPDYVCMVYATAPFLTGSVLRQSYEQLRVAGKKVYCLGVTEFRYPIQRAVYRTRDGGIRMFQPEHFFSRSQDLVKAYHDAGQFLWGTAEAFLRELPVFEAHTIPFMLPSYQVQDIDTEDDWIRAEMMYQIMNSPPTAQLSNGIEEK